MAEEEEMGRNETVYVIGFEVPLKSGTTLQKMPGAASNQAQHTETISQDQVNMDLFHDRIFPIQRPVPFQPV